MEPSVFDYQDYKAFLKAWIRSRPSKGHGEKSRIAQCVRCRSGYISQVLEGDAQLSLEQAALLNGYLGHSSEESRFFLFLVQLARAGNGPLREQFESLIREIHEKRNHLRNRRSFRKSITPEVQAIYYSAWYYTAVHSLLWIPQFRTREEIAKRLGLSVSKVAEVLEFLVSTGLAVERGKQYEVGTGGIHLGDDSPFHAKHHVNWRLKAVEALDRPEPSNLHFSSVGSIAEKDLPRLRASLLKVIEELRASVEQSGDETLFAFNIDLFKPR